MPIGPFLYLDIPPSLSITFSVPSYLYTYAKSKGKKGLLIFEKDICATHRHIKKKRAFVGVVAIVFVYNTAVHLLLKSTWHWYVQTKDQITQKVFAYKYYLSEQKMSSERNRNSPPSGLLGENNSLKSLALWHVQFPFATAAWKKPRHMPNTMMPRTIV